MAMETQRFDLMIDILKIAKSQAEKEDTTAPLRIATKALQSWKPKGGRGSERLTVFLRQFDEEVMEPDVLMVSIGIMKLIEEGDLFDDVDEVLRWGVREDIITTRQQHHNNKQ